MFPFHFICRCSFNSTCTLVSLPVTLWNETNVFVDWLQPVEIIIDDESKLTLHGLQQYYIQMEENEKSRKICDLLDLLEFNQVNGHLTEISTIHLVAIVWPTISKQTRPAVSFCQVIIFVNSISRCQALTSLLLEQNFPVLTIHRAMEQTER